MVSIASACRASSHSMLFMPKFPSRTRELIRDMPCPKMHALSFITDIISTIVDTSSLRKTADDIGEHIDDDATYWNCRVQRARCCPLLRDDLRRGKPADGTAS